MACLARSVQEDGHAGGKHHLAQVGKEDPRSTVTQQPKLLEDGEEIT